MLQHAPIVKDETLNKQLFEKGYITLPFLNQQAVSKLREIFYAHHGEDAIKGLYVSTHIKDWDELLDMNEKIKAVVEPVIDTHFQNVQKIGGTFIVKAPDENNILHPHQDWRIVDEDHYRSFTIWIALQDTTDENGAMYVLPGSHEWIRGYRHITIPSVYGKIYDLTWEYMLPIHLKAGEAVVFDQALVHASKPNVSPTLRIAAVNTLISEGAEFRICCNNSGVVEEYVCPSGFYVKPEAQSGHFDLPKIKDTDFKMVQLDEEWFRKFVAKEGLKKNKPSTKGLLKTIKEWLQ